MDKFSKGTANFDQLIVLGREFLHPTHKEGICAFDYAFEVKPSLSAGKISKKGPLHYDYDWSGHFSLINNSTRICLHNQGDDYGLVALEAKITLVKEKLAFFTKEIKARFKDNKEGVINERHWLNGSDSNYTGYIAFRINGDGSGSFTVADCHKSLIVYCDVYFDADCKPIKNDEYRNSSIKCLETMTKGFARAEKAIQELRKFFERELESAPT